jgi:hypothetical protein
MEELAPQIRCLIWVLRLKLVGYVAFLITSKAPFNLFHDYPDYGIKSLAGFFNSGPH